jgi:hypothetical protein
MDPAVELLNGTGLDTISANALFTKKMPYYNFVYRVAPEL